MEAEPKPKLNWWVDLCLFLAGPVIVTGAAWSRGADNTLAQLALSTTAIFSLALTVRLVSRWGSSSGERTMLGLFLACAVAVVIFSMTIVGCSVGLNFGR